MLEKLAEKYGNPIGVACLVISALLWGGEYVVAKDVYNVISPNWSNVIRTLPIVIGCLIIWREHFRNAKPADWKRGAVCGILFGLGYAVQSIGLSMINAGLSAFISSAYIIMVPFMVWIVSKIRPAAKVFVSAVIGITGVFIMSVTGVFDGELSIGLGEVLSIASAIGYGGAMVALDIYTEKSSVEFLTANQFIYMLIASLVFALLMEEPPALLQVMDGGIVLEFLYMILLGTFATQLLFTFGMKYATASQGGVIFPLESVSATLFGCIFLGEKLDWTYILGGVLLVAAIIISSVEFPKRTARNKETL